MIYFDNLQYGFNLIKSINYLFCLDPCARVNCNHGRCEVDRSTAVCRCYQGYTGHDCLTPLGKQSLILGLAAPLLFVSYLLDVVN